jgi:hypothetical protein
MCAVVCMCGACGGRAALLGGKCVQIVFRLLDQIAGSGWCVVSSSRAVGVGSGAAAGSVTQPHHAGVCAARTVSSLLRFCSCMWGACAFVSAVQRPAVSLNHIMQVCVPLCFHARFKKCVLLFACVVHVAGMLRCLLVCVGKWVAIAAAVWCVASSSNSRAVEDGSGAAAGSVAEPHHAGVCGAWFLFCRRQEMCFESCMRSACDRRAGFWF